MVALALAPYSRYRHEWSTIEREPVLRLRVFLPGELEKGVAWQINVRMRLFRPGLAFKGENPSDRILTLTAIASTRTPCIL